MNKAISSLIICFISLFSLLSAKEFTVCSYNCGGLSNHYDYLRAACMQKLIQQRYQKEPHLMATLEKVQKLALKILFAEDSAEAKQMWEDKGCGNFFEKITLIPTDPESPNAPWHKASEEMITSYNIRPVNLMDEEVKAYLSEHLQDLSQGKTLEEFLVEGRSIMAERIFHHHLKHDIICLQEADYLDASLFPREYEVLFSDTKHSINGVAWKKERFELTNLMGNLNGRAFIVELMDKETKKTLLIASAHLSGCNPFQRIRDHKTQSTDSDRGDRELEALCQLFETCSADLKLIAMDSNVTATHPRLALLKEYGYQLDYENFLEPTCTNPYQVLNTRIDWIAVKSEGDMPISISNVPVFGVGLNHIQTNISDHKPIAALVD